MSVQTPTRTLCLLAVLSLGCLTLPAAPAWAQATAPVSTTELSAQSKFIQNLGDQAISILAEKQLSAAERDTKFRDMLHNSFDLQTIGRFVIGRNWATATPEQQTEYMKLFEALVVKTYSDRFALYTSEGFKVRSSVAESDKDTIVNSEITRADGSKGTEVTWRVRQKNGKLGILDVVVEGVSMSVTQRQEYTAVLQRNGGDFNGLLQIMRDKLGSTAKETWKN